MENLIKFKKTLEENLEKNQTFYKVYANDRFDDFSVNMYSEKELNPTKEDSIKVARNYAEKIKTIIEYMIRNKTEFAHFSVEINYGIFAKPNNKIVDEISFDDFFNNKSFIDDTFFDKIYNYIPLKNNVALVCLETTHFILDEDNNYEIDENPNTTISNYNISIVDFEIFIEELNKLGIKLNNPNNTNDLTYRNSVKNIIQKNNTYFVFDIHSKQKDTNYKK